MVDLNSLPPSRQAELREAIELIYFAYRSFTDQPDRILERRGLGRTHHRILYFISRQPDISVQGLLKLLAVTKQALNVPLRQLIEMDLVTAVPAPEDRRIKRLRLTPDGQRLEQELTGVQMRLLQDAFAVAGAADADGWLRIQSHLAGRTRPDGDS
jgi:DNA-binding MarR family transcriptional regulator